MQDCLAVISRYPQLIKAATSALAAVVAAASHDATDHDIHTLSLGFLSAESQARYAALQAAQVGILLKKRTPLTQPSPHVLSMSSFICSRWT